MEIEIVTTKKKLTKSIVNQMRWAPDMAIKHGESLGYFINVVKNMQKAILIKYDGEYYIFPSNFRKGESAVYRTVGRWSQKKAFESPQETDMWYQAYQKLLNETVDQIYI